MKHLDKETVWNLGVAMAGMMIMFNGIINGAEWNLIRAHAASGVYSEEDAKKLYKSIKYANLNKVKGLINK